MLIKYAQLSASWAQDMLALPGPLELDETTWLVLANEL